MEYWKVKKCIRAALEMNKEKVTDRAEARVIKMSQKGYTSMMEKHTMSVKKLEEVASILNKEVSFFFVKSEKEEKPGKEYVEAAKVVKMDVANEPCSNCAVLQKKIDQLNADLIESQKETIAALRGERRAPQVNCG